MTAFAGRISRRNLLAAGVSLLLTGTSRAAPLHREQMSALSSADLSRVVSIGGAITEILYELGVSDRIVAVDSTSQFPPAALKDKQNVGYMRRLSPEGVLSLRPTLILAMADAGPPQALETLAASSVPMLLVDASATPEALLTRVQTLAELFHVKDRGEALRARIQAGFAELAAWRETHPGQKKVLFLLSMQNGRPIVAGAETAAAEIIALAGGVNAANALEGYKPVSDEAVVAMAPDVVLTIDHAGPAIDAGILDTPAFRQTPAGRRHALIHMDGEFLLGLGPRTPTAALELAKRLVAA